MRVLFLSRLMSVWHGSEHTPPHTIRVHFSFAGDIVFTVFKMQRERWVWEKAHSKHRKSVIHSDACISTARRDVFTSLCWRWSSTHLCVFSDELSDVNSSYRLFCTRGIDIYVFSFSNRDCDPAVVVIVLLALVCLRQFELYGRRFFWGWINEMFAVCEIWTILETKLSLIKVSGSSRTRQCCYWVWAIVYFVRNWSLTCLICWISLSMCCCIFRCDLCRCGWAVATLKARTHLYDFRHAKWVFVVRQPYDCVACQRCIAVWHSIKALMMID